MVRSEGLEPFPWAYRDCRMERRASCEGAHVPFWRWRHNSLSDARTDTTMVRWRAFSGVLEVVYEAPSARWASPGCASVMAAAMASEGDSWLVVVFSERTDIAANVRAKQPNRVVRIVSLLSVAVLFFLFLEASSSIGARVRR